MVYAGKQITAADDPLVKVPLDYLYHSIVCPKSEVIAKIRQLRIIRDIDSKQYGRLKKELPYIVCGSFNPPYRRTQNFAFIEYFILDIDHISQKGLSIETVRNTLAQDNRTVMLFASPGEDGLKVMLKLKERCYDQGLYSLFYKSFSLQYSTTYHLEQVIDNCTCDVSRACFVSYDPQAYYCDHAQTVDIGDYLDINNPLTLFDLKSKLSQSSQQQTTPPSSSPADKEPDDDSIQRIKVILKLQRPAVEKPQAYVPQQLNDIIGNVKRQIEETGIVVSEIINISYGKKIRMTLGMKQAEVNIFYGKRGFSVVKSPRCGTNSELNDLTASLIESFLAQL